MIRAVRKVVVPVENLDVAKEFWTKTVGFELVQDMPFGNGDRWLEVMPPDHDTILILSQRPADQVRPSDVPEQRPHSHVMLGCDDIHATHQELVNRGVRFPTPPTQMPFGWWAMFEDAEGTRFSLSPLSSQ